MKMAKPSEKDNEAVLQFFQELEETLDNSLTDVTDEAIAKAVLRHWPAVAMSWSRVYWAGLTAIENACDPDLTYLDYKPELKRLMENAGS